jgi:hypothetical protein
MERVTKGDDGPVENTHFPRKLNTMLHTRIRLKRLPLDLIQQIRSAAQKLAVRELPGLRVGRRPLRARCL